MASIIFTISPRCGKRHGPRPGNESAYNQRDKVLMRLGFASYRDYLRSALWKELREEKLAANARCEICGDKAQIVHHISYRRNSLAGKHLGGLVSLCNRCHCRVELREDGTKRGFEATLKKTKRLLKSRRRDATIAAPIAAEDHD